MKITVVFKAEIVAHVPERWLATYKDGFSRWPDKKDIYGKLIALRPPVTAEQVNAIIGNSTWTACECEGCGIDSPVLFRIGDEPDYTNKWVDLCHSCIGEIATFVSDFDLVSK